MESHSELSRLAPTTRFTDRVDDYVKFRPDYPAAAADAVLNGCDRSTVVLADVGAGTGISSRWIAERLTGGVVLAVEPNRAMRDGAETHPRVRWADGSAESTGLPAGSVDVVLCAQAFHWFKPIEALAEFARVLRPGGRVALMWNDRDQADPFTRAYTEAFRRATQDHPALRDFSQHDALERSLLFTDFRVRTFRHGQRLDGAGLLGRAQSASYCPKEGPAWETLKRELLALHARFAGEDGCAELVYRTSVYSARKR